MIRAIFLLCALLVFTDVKAQDCLAVGNDCPLESNEMGICKQKNNCAEGEPCVLKCKRKKCGEDLEEGKECTRRNGKTGICEKVTDVVGNSQLVCLQEKCGDDLVEGQFCKRKNGNDGTCVKECDDNGDSNCGLVCKPGARGRGNGNGRNKKR